MKVSQWETARNVKDEALRACHRKYHAAQVDDVAYTHLLQSCRMDVLLPKQPLEQDPGIHFAGAAVLGSGYQDWGGQ